jgi:hypothetical protein
MQSMSTIGLDIAKSIFLVHGVDAASKVVMRRQLRRRYIPALFPETTAVHGRQGGLRVIRELPICSGAETCCRLISIHDLR